MANPVNIFDFVNEDLATFLAKAVPGFPSDTNADIFTTLKTDDPGQEADPDEMANAAGQLWGNAEDDFMQAAYPFIRQVATGGVPASALSAVLLIGQVTGARDIVFSVGQGSRGVDAADATVTDMFVRGGDYSGASTDDAGNLLSRGGDTTSADSSSDGGTATYRGGNAVGGTAGPFIIGGSTGTTASASTMLGSETTANNPAGTLEVAAGDAAGGGFPAVTTLRGGEPKTVDTNSRPAGGMVVRGGDGDGQGLAGTHAGGPATLRGGDGVSSAAGGNTLVRAGNSGPGTNADAGVLTVQGASSTGNRVGGFLNNVGGPAAGSGDGGSWTWVPGTSGSGTPGTMVVGSATVDFDSNALNVTGNTGRLAVYSVATDMADKQATLLAGPRVNSQGLWAMIVADGINAANVLRVGGSTGQDSATQVAFYTASGTNTAGTPAGTITSNQRWVLGTTTEAFPGNALNVAGSSGRVVIYDTATDVTVKTARIGGAHFTNSEEPVLGILISSASTTSTVTMGGGTGLFNAATNLDFRTAANNTTTAGTSRMTINSSGVVAIVGAAVVTGNATLAANNLFDASGLLTSGNPQTDATTKAFRMNTRAFANSDGQWRFLTTSANVASNTLLLGGASAVDGATSIEFMTSTAVNTASTLRGSMSSIGLFDWVGDIRQRTAFLDGDEGTGIASTVGITNVVDGVSGGPLTVADHASLTLVHTGWLKIYNGTTATYIPTFTD